MEDFGGEGEDRLERLRRELGIGLQHLFTRPSLGEEVEEEVDGQTSAPHHRLRGHKNGKHVFFRAGDLPRKPRGERAIVAPSPTRGDEETRSGARQLAAKVGDVCLSRRKNQGRHTVVPLHASIQEHCRALGFDNLAPIIWSKIANAAYEVENGSGGFLGKPYEPNAVIKNDIEFILMQRKPGGYRAPSVATRVLSVISAENHRKWFQQIWTDVKGASTREHPAPYPLELADRLVRMFTFVGDTVLDPFMGTATTNLAALRWGRNSVGVEVDPHYFAMAHRRVTEAGADLFGKAAVQTHGASDLVTL